MPQHFADPQTRATYTLIARGSKVFASWDATPDDEYEVPQTYLNQRWVKVGMRWITYKPLRDTFPLFDSLDTLAEYFLPWWNDVHNEYGAAVRNNWSHLGEVTGKSDLGNRVYNLVIMCALQLRRDRERPLLPGLQHYDGSWSLGAEKMETS